MPVKLFCGLRITYFIDMQRHLIYAQNFIILIRHNFIVLAQHDFIVIMHNGDKARIYYNPS